jgi:HlyD family secretion protein
MSQPGNSLDELRIDRSEAARGGSKGWIWIVVIVTALAVAALGLGLNRGRAVPVRTQAVREGAAAAGGGRTVLDASGYVVARREATVSSKVTGKVIEVLVEEGMRVEEGQVLARLDDTNVKAGFNLAEAELTAAKAQLAETRARIEEADKQLRRIAALAGQKVASASDLDGAEANVKSLQARLELQQAQVEVSARQVALWQQQLEDTVIRAPFAGIAVSKNAQPGEMISPVSAGGGFTRTGIGTVVDMNSLEIEVDVNESNLNHVQRGQPVEARLDAYPDWKIPAKVLTVIPTADRQKSTVKVRIQFDHLDPRILPQMGVKVAFQGTNGNAPGNRAVVVPQAAVRKEDGRAVVFVVQNGRAERRAVTVGGTQAGDTTLVGGLSSGERVVVEPPPTLTDGARVQERKP